MLEPMAQEMGKEMLRFHRLYGEKISRRFRQLHIDRLSQTEYLLLAIIVERKHLPMSELCERAMMRKQQVTQTVNQLEDKSLVVRVRNNENRRVVWLEPTEQALEIAREVQQALVEELSPHLRPTEGRFSARIPGRPCAPSTTFWNAFLPAAPTKKKFDGDLTGTPFWI